MGDYPADIRGLMTLQPTANWTEKTTPIVYNATAMSFIFESLFTFDDHDDFLSETYQLTSWVLPEESMHRAHAALVQQILQDTYNPAIALQELYTTLLQLSYYDFFGQYNVYAPATYGLATPVLIPRRWTCFSSIVGLLGLHFFLVIVSLVLFLMRTEMSLLGNAWQAVSQVMSDDTAHTVHHGATATDEEVKYTVQQSGNSEGTIVIARSASTGRSEATNIIRRR